VSPVGPRGNFALVGQGDATLSQASLVRVQTRSEPRMHLFGSIKSIIEARRAGALRRGERIDDILGRAAKNAERVALNHDSRELSPRCSDDREIRFLRQQFYDLFQTSPRRGSHCASDLSSRRPHDIRSGMDYVGTVSSEGGPFLLADGRAIRVWRGLQTRDYEKLCDDLSAAAPMWGIAVTVDGRDAVAWEPEGGCIAHMYGTSQHSLVLVRVFTSELGRADAVRDAGIRAPVGATDDIGRIDIDSGILTVLWAPESGACVLDKDLAGTNPRPSGTVVIEGSCLLVRLEPGRYRCAADSVDVEDGTVLRCRIDPESAR